jgi:hypothetical protein
MEEFDLHGGFGCCTWVNNPRTAKQYEIVQVVSPRGNLEEHEKALKVAWDFADHMLRKPEFQGMNRWDVASLFIAHEFSTRMGNDDEMGARMSLAYAFLKVHQREHMIIFYNRATGAIRWETISGKHERAMRKIKDRVRAVTYQDFAALLANLNVKMKH